MTRVQARAVAIVGNVSYMGRPIRAATAQNDEAETRALVGALRTEVVELRAKVELLERLVTARLVAGSAPAGGERLATRRSLVKDEKAAISHALERAGGQMTEAARLLGMPRRTLYRKVKAHRLG